MRGKEWRFKITQEYGFLFLLGFFVGKRDQTFNVFFSWSQQHSADCAIQALRARSSRSLSEWNLSATDVNFIGCTVKWQSSPKPMSTCWWPDSEIGKRSRPDPKEFRVRLSSAHVGGMWWPAEIVRRNTGSYCIALFVTLLLRASSL